MDTITIHGLWRRLLLIAGVVGVLHVCSFAQSADLGVVAGWDSSKPVFRFIAIADPHLMEASRAPRSIPQFISFIENIKALDADFLVVLGDVCGENRPALSEIAAAAKATGYPVHFISGNHDDNNGRKPEEFLAAFGRMRYAFNHKGWQFVVDWSQRPDYDWLAETLSGRPEGASSIFFQHYPPSQRIQTVLRKHDVAMAMSGHMHFYRAGMTGTMRNVTLAWFQDGFAVVDAFADKRMRVNWRPQGVSKSLTVVTPTEGAALAAGKRQLVVNAFDSYRDVVKVEYDAGAGYLPLTQDTDRSWSAALDAAGAGGISVRATDNTGEVWTARCSWKLASAKSAPRLGGDWPVWGGKPDNRRSTEDDTAPPLRLAWRTALGKRCSQPVLDRGKIFVAVTSQGFADGDAVVALDAATGEQLWRAPMLGASLCPAAVVGDTVAIIDRFQRAYGFDAETGRALWRREDIRGTYVINALTSMINAADDVVYAGNMHALAAGDGSPLWRQAIAHRSNRPPAVDNGRIIGSGPGLLYCRDASDGKELWKIGNYSTYRASVLLPDAALLNGNRLVSLSDGGDLRKLPMAGWDTYTDVAVSRDGALMVYGTPGGRGSPGMSLTALKLGDGSRLWSTPLESGAMSAPSLSRNFAWITTEDGMLRAVSLGDGKTVWSHSFGIRMESPIASGDGVFVAGDDGCVYALCAL